MQISQNDLSFNGGFHLKKCNRKYNDYFSAFAEKKQTSVIEHFLKQGGKFVAAHDSYDRKIIDYLNKNNAVYTYYPQIKPTMLKKKGEKEIAAMLRDLIPDDETINGIVKKLRDLLKIKMKSVIVTDSMHGVKKVIDLENKDIILITPKNSNDINYVKYIPGTSHSDGPYMHRYAFRGLHIVKPYDDIDLIPTFLKKCKKTLIVENKG